MDSPSLNRFLVLLLIGLFIFDVVLTIALNEPIEESVYYLVLVPMGFALMGRGGAFIYYLGLVSSALLSLLIPLFLLILVMDITGFEEIDYEGDPIALLAMLVIVIYGVVGITSWFLIRSTHPNGPDPKRLKGTMGDLFIGMIFSILFIVGLNFGVILIAVVLQGWSYGEIIWVYYLDTLAFLVISANAMMKLENYTVESEALDGKSREQMRKELVQGYLLAGGIFMLVYAVLFAFTLVPPSLTNLIIVLVVGLGFVLLHYNDFRVKLPKLESESPDIVKLQQGFGVRILPMHLTAMLAMLLLIADDAEMRSATLMVVFVFLKVTVDIITEIVEFVRESRMILEKRRKA